jgi:hypothetical protein
MQVIPVPGTASAAIGSRKPALLLPPPAVLDHSAKGEVRGELAVREPMPGRIGVKGEPVFTGRQAMI